MDVPVQKKIVRNSVFNVGGYFWQSLIQFLLAPYVVARLGGERFGVYALVFVITSYLKVFDFGISSAFSKYISEYYTKEDHDSLNGVINSGFLFYLAFVIVVLPVGILLSKDLVGIFNFNRGIFQEVHFAFVGALIILSLRALFGIFDSVLEGIQRMDVGNGILVAISLFQAGGVIFVLESGYGLRGLILNVFLFSILTVIITISMVYRFVPETKFNPFSFNKKVFQRLFKFGIRVQTTQIAGLINFQADRVLIPYFLNVGLLTFYELGFRIAYVGKSVISLLLPAITPATAELEARQSPELIKKLFEQGTRYLVLAAFPLGCFLIITAPRIMQFWMGQGYERSAWVIRVLTIGYFFNVFMGGMGCFICRGLARVTYEMRSSVVVSLLNILLSIILIIKIGFIGAAIGTSISTMVGTIYLMSMFHKNILRLSKQFLYNLLIRPSGACLTAGLMICLVNLVLTRVSFLSTRIGQFFILLIQAFLFFPSFYFFVAGTGYFTRQDKELIIKNVSLGWAKMK